MKYQELLNEIQAGKLDGQSFFKKRSSLMEEIQTITGRPLIVYAAKIEVPREAPNQIVLEDLIGFTDLIADIDGPKLDVLIESPGGIVDATHRIVHLLRQKYTDIRFIIPGSAYSAATMIALSGNKILMDDAASLGPIDPQINGIPARSVLNGFDAVRQLLKKEGPSSLPAYLPLLQKYDLHIFEICKDAEERGKQLVGDWLKAYMFKDQANTEKKIADIVTFFSDYDTHKSHARPIFITDAQKIGLDVENLSSNPELRKKVWELFLCIKVFFDVTINVKIFENTKGINWGKQFLPPGAAIQMRPMPQPAQPAKN